MDRSSKTCILPKQSILLISLISGPGRRASSFSSTLSRISAGTSLDNEASAQWISLTTCGNGVGGVE